MRLIIEGIARRIRPALRVAHAQAHRSAQRPIFARQQLGRCAIEPVCEPFD
jgi:hypothetical protein